MKKIDWGKRIKNKVFLLAMAGAIIAFVYQIMGIVGVVPSVSQDSVTQTVGMVINLLVVLGIVADPTTPGVKDQAVSPADEAVESSRDDIEVKTKEAK